MNISGGTAVLTNDYLEAGNTDSAGVFNQSGGLVSNLNTGGYGGMVVLDNGGGGYGAYMLSAPERSTPAGFT